MSLVLPKTDLATVRTAVCLCRSIERYCENKVRIKWVNDIFSEGKKVSGILCELAGDKIIVGIGINIGNAEFPSELQGIAGSVRLLKDRETLIADIAAELANAWQKNADAFLSEYESRLFVIGKRIEYTKNNEKHDGVAVGINQDGNLVVSNGGNLTILNSGEITLGSDNFTVGE